jgi:hypothetical protein
MHETSQMHIQHCGSMLSQLNFVNNACNIAQTCRIQWVSTIWTQIVGTDLQHSGSTKDVVDLLVIQSAVASHIDVKNSGSTQLNLNLIVLDGQYM